MIKVILAFRHIEGRCERAIIHAANSNLIIVPEMEFTNLSDPAGKHRHRHDIEQTAKLMNCIIKSINILKFSIPELQILHSRFH